jgi:hypothetical protein
MLLPNRQVFHLQVNGTNARGHAQIKLANVESRIFLAAASAIQDVFAKMSLTVKNIGLRSII